MRRKTSILAMLAILLTMVTAGTTPAYDRLVSSVRSFQQNFGDLKKADSMSAIERFMFSLVLSSSNTPPRQS